MRAIGDCGQKVERGKDPDLRTGCGLSVVSVDGKKTRPGGNVAEHPPISSAERAMRAERNKGRCRCGLRKGGECGVDGRYSRPSHEEGAACVVFAPGQDFGEDVGEVVAGGDVADADEVVGDHFAEPEESHGHVAGIFVGLLTVGAEDGGGVVDVDGHGRWRLEAELVDKL